MWFLPSGTTGMVVLVALVLLVISGVLVFTAPEAKAKARTRERLKALTGPNFDSALDDVETALLRRKDSKRANYLASLAVRAGGNRAVPFMFIGAVIAAVAAFAAVTFVLRPPVVVPALAAIGAAVGGAWIVLRMMITKREQAFLAAFPDALDLIVRAVRAGIPVTETINLVAEEGGEPVSTEFQAIAEELSLGVDMAEALKTAAQRISIPDFNFFVVSLMLQRETGGGLAETLENLSNVVRRRKELRLKIKALTSEGRISAKIVGGIPLCAIGAISFLRPEYMEPLIYDPSGRLLLAAGTGSICLGMFIINRLTRMPQ